MKEETAVFSYIKRRHKSFELNVFMYDEKEIAYKIKNLDMQSP